MHRASILAGFRETEIERADSRGVVAFNKNDPGVGSAESASAAYGNGTVFAQSPLGRIGPHQTETINEPHIPI